MTTHGERLQVADNMPLYGICCYMDELVHRPPAILSDLFHMPSPPLTRYLVSAPRCYCMLTHYPFFSLHFKVRVAQLIPPIPICDRSHMPFLNALSVYIAEHASNTACLRPIPFALQANSIYPGIMSMCEGCTKVNQTD